MYIYIWIIMHYDTIIRFLTQFQLPVSALARETFCWSICDTATLWIWGSKLEFFHPFPKRQRNALRVMAIDPPRMDLAFHRLEALRLPEKPTAEMSPSEMSPCSSCSLAQSSWTFSVSSSWKPEVEVSPERKQPWFEQGNIGDVLFLCIFFAVKKFMLILCDSVED